MAVQRSFAAVAILLASAAQASAEYTITLDPPGSVYTHASGVSRNNVVGYYYDQGFDFESCHGFIFDGSSYTTLDFPGTSGSTRAYGVSGSKVVGDYGEVHPDGSFHDAGFLFDGLTYTSLDPPGAFETTARAVSGTKVVGVCQGLWEDHPYAHYRGFVYDCVDRTYTWLDPPTSPTSYGSYAFAISGNNVVGQYADGETGQWHGFLYDGFTYTTLDPPGSNLTRAYGVSGRNVVGYYEEGLGRRHGFLYDGSTYTTLDVPHSIWTEAQGVDGNNVVGQYRSRVGDDFPVHAFLYDGSTYTTIDPGGVDSAAVSVSGSNVVGYYRDGRHGYSPHHGFLHVIPEPSTLVMISPLLGTLGIALGWCRRWKQRGEGK